MHESIEEHVGQSLFNFQAALKQSGSSLGEFIRTHYVDRWRGDQIYHALAIRTTFVNALQLHLAREGLFNMERVSLSPVTDPLAHDVEHTPSIRYKGHTYLTTHSMIYSKLLALFNPRLKGIFVDSPNIRLELESPTRIQRGKYLIDFSQMDIEVRRPRGVDLETYLNDTAKVQKILREDHEEALAFFERLVIAATSAVVEANEADLAALGVALEVPASPFPRFRKDEAAARFGTSAIDGPLGRSVSGQFFWITGLMRENYDLIYPYLQPGGAMGKENDAPFAKRPISEFSSDMIYNYDLVAQSRRRSDGALGPALEVLSGGLREWLYEAIVERLIDNGVLEERPRIVGDNIENIHQLGGYGPFLLAAWQRDERGRYLFPETYGGGLGVERCLFALCRGESIRQVDQVTLFGKNPDSYPLYLF
jgi:aspartyl/asparaginyl-tRNA synthetase